MKNFGFVGTASRSMGMIGLLAVAIGGCDGTQSDSASATESQGAFSASKLDETTYQVQAPAEQVSELVESLRAQGASVEEQSSGAGYSSLKVTDLPAPQETSAAGEDVQGAVSGAAGLFSKKHWCVRYEIDGDYCYADATFRTYTAAFTWWTSAYCMPWMLPSKLREGKCVDLYPGLPR